MSQSTIEDCEIPSFYIDPVTCEIMVNPHLLPSGHCFDLDTIKLLTPKKCPITRMPFTMNDIMPNNHLKSLIESKIEFIKMNIPFASDFLSESELDMCKTYIKTQKSYYEKLERERLERLKRLEQLEQSYYEKLKQERLERERLERERLEQLERERLERERLERERLERERLEQLERERLEQLERLERRRQEKLEHMRRRQEELEQKRLKRIYRLERSESERLERREQVEQERLQSKRFKRAQFEQEQHEQLKYEQKIYKQVTLLTWEHPDYDKTHNYDSEYSLEYNWECNLVWKNQIKEWAINLVLQEQPECNHVKLRLRFEQNKILIPKYIEYQEGTNFTFIIKPDAALFEAHPDIHERWKEQQHDLCYARQMKERATRITQHQERKLRHIAMLERHREEKKQRHLSNSLY